MKLSEKKKDLTERPTGVAKVPCPLFTPSKRLKAHQAPAFSKRLCAFDEDKFICHVQKLARECPRRAHQIHSVGIPALVQTARALAACMSLSDWRFCLPLAILAKMAGLETRNKHGSNPNITRFWRAVQTMNTIGMIHIEDAGYQPGSHKRQPFFGMARPYFFEACGVSVDEARSARSAAFSDEECRNVARRNKRLLDESRTHTNAQRAALAKEKRAIDRAAAKAKRKAEREARLAARQQKDSQRNDPALLQKLVAAIAAVSPNLAERVRSLADAVTLAGTLKIPIPT